MDLFDLEKRMQHGRLTSPVPGEFRCPVCPHDAHNDHHPVGGGCDGMIWKDVVHGGVQHEWGDFATRPDADVAMVATERCPCNLTQAEATRSQSIAATTAKKKASTTPRKGSAAPTGRRKRGR